MVEITIRSLTGRSIPVEIDLQQRVSDLKEVVEVKEGIPPAQQRFLFTGRQLDDDKTLAECGVANGSDLHLVLSLRGAPARVKTLEGVDFESDAMDTNPNTL
ncbi:hypothetical protein CAS74_000135 [Pichia kudriavzevii]|uniref:Ubiquitin-like domain-containing protein n=1 Tax=Pichia kudriavzevii TaxID=4909 RepID=A0A1Z8JT49_PICKU|nr:hypothetical protein CAS74_000135 [Pichia kudriavzevii]